MRTFIDHVRSPMSSQAHIFSSSKLYTQYRNITDHNKHSPSPKTRQSTTGSTQHTMAKKDQICSPSLFTGTGYLLKYSINSPSTPCFAARMPNKQSRNTTK